jgi:hypothetical protein
MKQVTRVTQSPLNKLRWCLDLECGHDEWVTSKRRPTTKKYKCSRCPKEADNG